MNTTTLLQAPDQYQMMLNNYASIVEKTNQHMNYWFDPYVLIIASLTILFTFGAIIVAILIFVNGAEAKKQRNKIFEELEKNVEEQKKIIKERNERESELSEKREKRVKEYEDSLDSLIKSYSEKLGKLDKDNKKDIERIEKVVDDLNKAKASLGNYELPEAVYDPAGMLPYGRYSDAIGRPSTKQTTCMVCGLGFRYKDGDGVAFPETLAAFSSKKVRCPHCGAENYV
ncbi:MAG: hypothetical protein AAB969_01840 [Patescibacteria group bacterium]